MSSPPLSLFSMSVSRDLDHYRAQPGNWNVQATQLGRGTFSSRIRSLKFPGLTIYDNKWGAASLIRGSAPDGVLMLGTAPEYSPVVRWCGEVPDQSRFACTAGGQEIEFSVDKGVHDVVFLIDPKLLTDVCGGRAVEVLQTQRHVDFDPTAGQNLINAALGLLNTDPKIWTCPGESLIPHDARCLLLDRLSRCFVSTEDNQPAEILGSVRKAAFQRALAHVSAVELKTSASQMAQAAGVSQKSLELVFKEQLGMTPARYLKTERLNLVHQQLSDSDQYQTTVTEVAMRCGFSHLGRFSADYQQLFRELPQSTLTGKTR